MRRDSEATGKLERKVFMNSSKVAVRPELVYGTRCDNHLLMDQYAPEQPNGSAIIFVNSGGFESGKLVQYTSVSPSSWRFLEANELTIEGSDPIPLLEQFSFAGLLGAGFTVFDVRHSNAPHTVDEMLDDVRAAVAYIHEHAAQFAIEPDRIGIFGASSGGFLAIAGGLTARSSDNSENLIRAIATYYPAGFDFRSDLEAFPQLKEGLPALSLDDAMLDAISIKSHIRTGAPSTLVIYGDHDFPFIINPCRSICSEFPKAGIETKCIVIEGAAHEFVREDGYHPEDGDHALVELLQWFEQQLVI